MAHPDRIRRVAQLTRGLAASYKADDETLEAVRLLIARDDQPDGGGFKDETKWVPELFRFVSDQDLLENERYADDEAGFDALERVVGGRGGQVAVERHTTLSDLPLESIGTRHRLRNIRPDRRLGPFIGPDGVASWFDLFVAAERVTVTEKGASEPVLVFSAARRQIANGVLSLDRGSVWIRAAALAKGGTPPLAGYVGFEVAKGRFEFESDANVTPEGFEVARPFKARLVLTLHPPEPFDGCPKVEIEAPQTLEIIWDGGVSVKLGDGRASLFGQSYSFVPNGGVRIDPETNFLVFDCDISESAFDTSAVSTAVARLAGPTMLEKPGWAVPLTLVSNAGSLADALGLGYWSARCSDAFGVSWRGGSSDVFTVEEARLLIGPGTFSIASTKVAPPASRTRHCFSLWPLEESGEPLPLCMHFAEPFTCVLGCDEQRGEYVGFTASCTPAFDVPVDTLGRSFQYAQTEIMALLNQKSGEAKITMAAQDSGTVETKAFTVALQNGYFSVSTPSFGSASGALIPSSGGIEDIDGDPNAVREGALLVGVRITDWVPTLPDPYVSNLAPSRSFGKEGTQQGVLLASARWDGGRPDVAFSGSLAPPSTTTRNPGSNGGSPGLRGESWYRGDSQTEDGRLPKGSLPWDSGVWDTSRPDPGPINDALDKQIRGATGRLVRDRGNALLLDVSTNRHQIGVAMGDRRGDGSQPGAFVIREQAVTTPLNRLQIFTLPLVQWEPVRTLDIDQDPITLGMFPTPLASADDGGATLFGTRSQTLAPSIPDVALRDMVGSFSSGEPMGLVTTMPFGLRAGIVLQPTADGARLEDKVVFVEPLFDEGAPLVGGLQLSLRAEGEKLVRGVEKPSFVGVAVQTLNGVDLATGTPLGISVLGSTAGSGASVETMFNNEFADAKPRVPLTRYDVSGYGASTFSDWRNPRGAFAEATKVQFQLLVGRTALEIVKFASIIYPWGIKVTRSVTIERRGGGGVIRRDSGWQAESDGLFDFRYQEETAPGVFTEQPDPYEKHPGLIEGVFDVERIRPLADDAIMLDNGASVLPMAFDAEVAIDGLESGRRARSEGMVGYLHVLPVGEPISEAEMVELLEREGPIGGPVDTTVRIGASRFAVRALRVEIGLSRDGTQPIMTGAVRGTPRFGPAGAWSVIRQPGPGNTAAPEDAELVTDGTPIIRRGRLGTPSGDDLGFNSARGDFRFAEIEDLFKVSMPSWELGFVQTTETHAFLYRRPFIVPGSTIIESVLSPCFADLYARSSSSSLFPPVDNTIVLSDEDYRLPVDSASGFFRLDPPVALMNPRSELILSEGSDRLRMFYDDTTLILSIGERDWSLSMPGLEMWNDMGGFEKTSGIRMNLVGGTTVKPQMQAIETLLASAVEDLMDFVPGSRDRGVQGPVDLSATNLKVKTKAVTYFEQIVDILPTLQAKFYGQTDVGSESDTSTGLTSFYSGAKVGVDVRGQTPPTPWFFLFGVAVELGGKNYLSGPLVGESKPTFEAKLYFGFGIGKEVGPFEAKVSFGIGGIVQYDVKWKYGGFLFFDAKVDLSIVKIKVFGEFAMLGYSKDDKSFIEYQGELGINVSFGWIFSIKVSVQLIEKDEV